MARYSTSYWKYGRQALNDVLNVLDQLRKKREEKEFYSNLIDLYNKAAERQKQISEGFDPSDIKYISGSKGEIKLGRENYNNELTGDLINYDLLNHSGQSATNESEAVKIPSIKMETPGDYVLGDYIPSTQEIKTEGKTISIPSLERYKRAKNILSDFQESIIPMLLTKNIDENKLAKINLLGNLLSQNIEKLKPQQPEIFNLGRGESRFIQFPGSLPVKIAEGQPYEETEKNPFTKVGADGYIYQWDFDKKQFVKTNLRAPVKEWQFAPNEKGEKSKTLSPTTAKLIADILSPREYVTDEFGNILKFKYDEEKKDFVRDEKGNPIVDMEEGKPMKISETDKKFRQTNVLKNVMLQTLSNRTYEFINNLEKMWGRRLTPKELKDEAIKHAKAGNLSDKEAGEIADFLPYYKEIYEGIK